MKRLFISIVFLWLMFVGKTQSINQYGDIIIDSFPTISFSVNVYDKDEPLISDFELIENTKSISFDVIKLDSELKNKNKTVLILFEDMTHNVHSGQKSYFQKMLSMSLPKFINKGDKINIAVFDRSRDGKSPLRYLLNEYTDNVIQLIDAVNRFESINDYQSDNKSSDLYKSIYYGLSDLNNSYKNDNKAILVLSASYSLPSSTDNTQESIITYAKESKIPIYSVNYLIWENRTLNKMSKETFGLSYTTDAKRNDLPSAITNTIQIMNSVVIRLAGYNYGFSFNTSFQQDGESHFVVLKYGNQNKEINFTVSKCDIVCWIKKNIIVSISIAATIFILFIILLIVRIKRKAKKELLLKEKEGKLKAEISKQDETIKKTNQKLQEIEKKKESEAKLKLEMEQREITRQMLISEIKANKGFPTLMVSVGGENHEYNINEPEITIGREDSNDLFISDNNISRKHFKISYLHGGFYIEDLKSTNGTILNGEMITQRIKLINNDIIQVGPIKITFIW